ncbi:box A-binding factor-like [Bactrocera dorsalis]|uniref:Box A-binding factor-like n=1 Tax=Bactrocera dorsalis TaxID=27457 RepID=A0ABM3JDC6_BACDO|nr:box A-binding factor-like [Bactrocera dorsalis]
MIHRDQSEGIAQTSDSTDTTEISTKSHVASIKANISNVPTSRSMLLGTAMVTICHNESTFTVRALIDWGSEATFVSNSLQKRLHLATKKVSARVSGLNNTVSGRVQSVCSITIGSPRNKDLKLEAEALVLPKLTGLLPSRSINSSIVKRLPNIPLADNNFYTSQKVDLLIGADLYPKIILNGVKSKIFGSLVAQHTVFGWILTGSVPSEETKKQHQQHQQQQQHQLQRDQSNDDGETNDAPGSSNHTVTHGSVGVPTLPAAALSLSATSVGSTPPSSAEATNANNFAYYTGAAETVAATHRHAVAATPPLPASSQSLPPSSTVAASSATAHYPPPHQQHYVTSNAVAPLSDTFHHEQMQLQLQQQYEHRYRLQTAHYHQQQQAPPSQSQQEDQQPSTQYQHARSNRQATQSTVIHHTTNTSQAATTTQQQQPAAMAHALTQITQKQQQPCQRTSAVTQSTDQRRLSRIPHAQDRARLESSRRLRHAGNFLSDWRHGNDRLRLDSSQRHCPDRTRLDSSRRPPHPKRRRGRDARRQADARRIIKDRQAALRTFTPGSRCPGYNQRQWANSSPKTRRWDISYAAAWQ